MTDDRVALGHAILALHEPHRGHEVAFNRFYERDHMYAALFAPWTMGAQRWVATRALKDLRYPEGEGPFEVPSDRGSYLTMYWIQDGFLEEQQSWISGFVTKLNEQGRVFEERDVMTATTYDYCGEARREPDGVPPEQALDHRFPGLVMTWLERDAAVPLDVASNTLLSELIPRALAGAPIGMTLAFTPLPKSSWWPRAAPEVPGVGDRLVLAHFLEAAPTECWDECFAGLGALIDAGGVAQTLLVAPFIPTVPGTDRYCDELGISSVR